MQTRATVLEDRAAPADVLAVGPAWAWIRRMWAGGVLSTGSDERDRAMAEELSTQALAAAWPGVSILVEDFRNFLNQRGETELPPHVHDLYLVFAARQGDTAALTVFETQFVATLRASVARIDSSPDFVEECLQALRERLLCGPSPRLDGYTGRGSLRAWLKVAATRLALDTVRTRKRRREQPPELAEQTPSKNAGPDEMAFKLRYAQVFERALAHAVTELSAHERTVLRLHFVEGLGADAIGRMYGRDRSNVYRWLRAWRARLGVDVREALRAEMGTLPESDFGSLVRLVGSAIDLDLSRLLPRVAEPAPVGEPESH
jgi:RNA polymerase sigma-70 factor, ECF subfamily